MKPSRKRRTKSQGKPALKRQKKSIYDYYGTPDRRGPVLKRQDVGTIQAFMDNTPTTAATLLSGIALGDAPNQRDGNHVRFKSIQLRLAIGCAPQLSAVIPASQARVIMFYDRAPNGAAPIWSDVVQNNNTGTSLVGDPIRFDNRDRFLILNDERFNLPGFGVVVAAGIPTYNADQQPLIATNEGRVRDWYHKFNWKLDSKFIAGTIGVASVGRGAFFLVWFCTIGAAGGTTPWFVAATSSTVYSDSMGNQ